METKPDVFAEPESTRRLFCEGNGATEKVLVVTGSSDLMELCRLVEQRGGGVFISQEGSRAIRKIKEVLPDLVVWTGKLGSHA